MKALTRSIERARRRREQAVLDLLAEALPGVTRHGQLMAVGDVTVTARHRNDRGTVLISVDTASQRVAARPVGVEFDADPAKMHRDAAKFAIAVIATIAGQAHTVDVSALADDTHVHLYDAPADRNAIKVAPHELTVSVADYGNLAQGSPFEDDIVREREIALAAVNDVLAAAGEDRLADDLSREQLHHAIRALDTDQAVTVADRHWETFPAEYRLDLLLGGPKSKPEAMHDWLNSRGKIPS